MAHRYFILAFKLYGRYFTLLKYILGLCNFYLEDYVMSEKCFTSYLKAKKGRSVFCLGALAVLYLKTRKYSKYKEIISNAFDLCENQKVFEINVMVCLAEHFLYNSDYENAQKIARMVLSINFEGRKRLVQESNN